MPSIDPTSSPAHPPSPSRRQWLKHGATFASALGLGSLGNLLVTPARAQAADYKALVCVFLYGGNDGQNTVVPTDTTRYNQYAAIRGMLAIPRERLLPLGASGYGLHPALGALSNVWAAGKLAPVFNVGPLQAPLTKTQLRALASTSDLIPDNLYSHSDQQVLWEAASARSQTRTGWGGRAAHLMGTTNPVIAIGANPRFGQSPLQGALVLPVPGRTFGTYGTRTEDLAWTPMALRKAALDALYAQTQSVTLTSQYSRIQRQAGTVSARLGGLVITEPGQAGSVPGIDSAFAPLTVDGHLATALAQQLYQVAKLIAGNAVVQGSRQMFFTHMNGFDTHAAQVSLGDPTQGNHARLLQELGDALGAFQQAMTNIGMADKVTTFTQSDFGRTFRPNNSIGTDHGWGNHQLVMGGAVKGGLTYGTHPSLVIGGPDDVGASSWEQEGRWIPSSSVDQYAATLLGWFGASTAQLDGILPNLVNFGTRRTLGFV